MVTDLFLYEFSCRNGVSLPNTVVNCSDDGLRLAVTIMPNESSCNCQKSITMKSSSTDLTTIATRSTESSSTDLTTIATRSTESSSTDLTTIATRSTESSSMDLTTIATRSMESTIDTSDLTDTEHHFSSNDGIDVIRALNCNGQIVKEYNNIPPKSHVNPSNDGIGVIRAFNCNGQMNNEYNNIPPKSHMNTSNDGMYVIRALNCNGQMDKEYNNIPPKSHMTLSSFSNIPYTHHLMVFERNSTSGKSDITFVEASELKIGSTEQPICTICDDDRISKTAVTWCTECEVFFCGKCEKPHRKSRLSKDHKTMSAEDYHQLPTFIEEISSQCKEHQEKFERYCPFHACLCCVQYITDKHQKCQDIKPSSVILNQAKSSASVPLFEKDLKNL
ncbi:unnamed protein product [Mytilus edulis]|uniref:B box-type domain-containing protein n=1 Tax=Mytilus edulis TaxID=6550 RepID=A0A8S3S9H8_MYTED|nr:unnamed protein product [Mytilus edulis]